MKGFLILLLTCMTIEVQANYVLWIGLAEAGQYGYSADSVINNGGNTSTISEYFGNSLEDVTIRVKLVESETYLDFIYFDKDENKWISYSGEEGGYAGPAGDGRKYIHWGNQVLVEDNLDYSTIISMEIGIWDENDNFIFVGESDFTTIGDVQQYTSGIGSVLQPNAMEWSPTVFYTDYPVPEPSIAVLAILGACAMLLRRKQIHNEK